MLSPELISPRAPGLATQTVSGWGRGVGAEVTVLPLSELTLLDRELLRSRGALARGMGRSYGDAAQLSGGFMIDTRMCKRLEFDAVRGEVNAGAGTTIGELLDAVVPSGWMVPVVPGTQHVSLGGAIASDVHGKNHGTAGTLGAHVRSLELLTSAGETLTLTPESDLFQATVGGMGLTGVILSARLALYRVPGPLVAVDTDRAADFDQAFALLKAPGGSLRVAWIDLVGPTPGRGVVTRAEHAGAPSRSNRRPTVRARVSVPERWPGGVLRESTVSLFNAYRYRRTPQRERGRVEGLGAHLFPLDALDSWPRLYGPAGFVQYQFVVPPEREHTLIEITELVRRARVPCFLAVLKDLGPAGAAPLSFPVEGWTLTMDLPRAASGLEAALDRCDELVAEAGGRVYLTKDARMKPEPLRAMYPRLDEWRAVRDRVDPQRVWRSDLSLRTGL